VAEFTSVVYAHPQYISTLATSTPVSDHVTVDFELGGCPIDKRQLLELLTALLAGRKPQIPAHSVCHDCKLRGTSS
jgi:sulfhydrogenase subunit delta